MSPSEKAASICSQLTEILSESSPYFAGLACSLGLAAEKGFKYAAPIYRSVDWWGGSGSFADSAGSELPPQQKKDVLRLVADLRDAFHEGGIDFPRADSWANVFRSWLRDGVFGEESL
jgi:hypothetical protein